MTYDEFMKMLMAEQIVPWTASDPYAPTLPTGYMGNALIQPTYDKNGNIEPFDLDTQKDAYNALQDWADINSDPAILGGLMGESPNYGETTYTPIPELTAVLNTAKQGDTTVEGMIANEIMSGGSTSSALKKIKALFDPASPDYDPDFAAIVPTYQKSELGEVSDLIDEDYLRQIGNQFQTAWLSVPLDPATGKPSYVIDPETGQPSYAKTELSELGQWYKDTNTPLPTDTYDPDILALAHTLEMERTAPERQATAQKRVTDLEAMRRRLLSEGPTVTSNAPRVAPGVPGAGGPVQGRERTPQRGGIADDLERLTQHPGQSVVGFAQNAGGRLSAIPGALSRNVGDPAERFVQGVQGFLGLSDEGEGAASAIEQAVRAAAAPSILPSRQVDRDIADIASQMYGERPFGQVQGPDKRMANEAMRQAAAYMGRSAGPAPAPEGSIGGESLLAARTPSPAGGLAVPEGGWARGRTERSRTPATFAQVQNLLAPGLQSERDRRLSENAHQTMTQMQLAEFARRDQLQAAYNQQVRQKMVEQLALRGHTPYNDTMARRRALAKAGGFGA